jgi:hypothetical protein
MFLSDQNIAAVSGSGTAALCVYAIETLAPIPEMSSFIRNTLSCKAFINKLFIVAFADMIQNERATHARFMYYYKHVANKQDVHTDIAKFCIPAQQKSPLDVRVEAPQTMIIRNYHMDIMMAAYRAEYDAIRESSKLPVWHL